MCWLRRYIVGGRRAGIGFIGERHLVVRFHEAYGCTPAAYRRSSTTAG
jgi:hypothetical protein